MKKCPFLIETVRVEQWQQSADDENSTIAGNGGTVISEKEKHTDCLEHECGAYYDGRCHYSEHI